MAVQMDDADIVRGDTVYDVIWGAGAVYELLPDGRFVVSFPAGRRQTYNSSGFSKHYKARTLYWANPFLAVPVKNEGKWALVRRLVAAIVQEVRADGM